MLVRYSLHEVVDEERCTPLGLYANDHMPVMGAGFPIRVDGEDRVYRVVDLVSHPREIEQDKPVPTVIVEEFNTRNFLKVFVKRVGSLRER